MFRRIEAVGYRCLKEVSQELNPFEILVGPNGSGKSALLDVIHFLGDVFRFGTDAAIQRRAPTFQDLVWRRAGNEFRLAVHLADKTELGMHASYDLSVALDPESGMIVVRDDTATLPDGRKVERPGTRLFANLFQGRPADDVAWIGSVLTGVRMVRLDPRALAEPSAPEREGDTINTGASLAWQIRRLQALHPEKLEAWTAHVRTALPDVCRIESALQQWDNRRFVRVQYENGLQVPAWMLSEGTLRLLALTILAYLPDFQGLYMIEEPENGVHPAAIETIYQSLSSAYNAQVFVSTHSPVLLSMAKPEQVLCFSKTSEGTKIVRGDQHPALRDWQGEVSLGTMIASGILDDA